eukprot:gnl/Spiro4/2130_TR1013_c0_g2_i1.p1 gnl/Spiro4/2130_TR1013_c0_g2~~gnl/Spiro4/2130_TR1013_c0_g2_i1.p1  ORF type:complete len:147 (-),score=12.24 gnl/Spiro4/2130_TR1013_c0_g2_i1:189-587(-)
MSRSRSRSPVPRRGRSRSPPPRGGGGGRRSASPGSDSEAYNPGNNIYVSGLSVRTTEHELERCFAKYGHVEKCELVYDPKTRESRGFAFVTMATRADAEDSIQGLNRSCLDGRVIIVEKVCATASCLRPRVR